MPNVIRVSPDESDSLEAALKKARDGDTLSLLPGVFHIKRPIQIDLRFKSPKRAVDAADNIQAPPPPMNHVPIIIGEDMQRKSPSALASGDENGRRRRRSSSSEPGGQQQLSEQRVPSKITIRPATSAEICKWKKENAGSVSNTSLTQPPGSAEESPASSASSSLLIPAASNGGSSPHALTPNSFNHLVASSLSVNEAGGGRTRSNSFSLLSPSPAPSRPITPHFPEDLPSPASPSHSLQKSPSFNNLNNNDDTSVEIVQMCEGACLRIANTSVDLLRLKFRTLRSPSTHPSIPLYLVRFLPGSNATVESNVRGCDFFDGALGVESGSVSVVRCSFKGGPDLFRCEGEAASCNVQECNFSGISPPNAQYKRVVLIGDSARATISDCLIDAYIKEEESPSAIGVLARRSASVSLQECDIQGGMTGCLVESGSKVLLDTCKFKKHGQSPILLEDKETCIAALQKDNLFDSVSKAPKEVIKVRPNWANSRSSVELGGSRYKGSKNGSSCCSVQ